MPLNSLDNSLSLFYLLVLSIFHRTMYNNFLIYVIFITIEFSIYLFANDLGLAQIKIRVRIISKKKK